MKKYNLNRYCGPEYPFGLSQFPVLAKVGIRSAFFTARHTNAVFETLVSFFVAHVMINVVVLCSVIQRRMTVKTVFCFHGSRVCFAYKR